MKTGNTEPRGVGTRQVTAASMEPGHEDREYRGVESETHRERSPASMEPGHEDREYTLHSGKLYISSAPQWSPVMKTGNTSSAGPRTTASPCLNGARS